MRQSRGCLCSTHRVVPISTQYNICPGDEPGAGRSQQPCTAYPMQGLCRVPWPPYKGTNGHSPWATWLLTLPGLCAETGWLLPQQLHLGLGKCPAAAAWSRQSPQERAQPWGC